MLEPHLLGLTGELFELGLASVRQDTRDVAADQAGGGQDPQVAVPDTVERGLDAHGPVTAPRGARSR